MIIFVEFRHKLDLDFYLDIHKKFGQPSWFRIFGHKPKVKKYFL